MDHIFSLYFHKQVEKLTEYLIMPFEMEHVLETNKFFIILSFFEKINQSKYPNSRKAKHIQSYFKNLKPVSKTEIFKILKKVYDI